MNGTNISPHYLISMKLAEYEFRHGGKRPARIFMSDSMFMDIVCSVELNYKTSATGENRFCGIPVSIFRYEGKKFYLSDEEE